MRDAKIIFHLPQKWLWWNSLGVPCSHSILFYSQRYVRGKGFPISYRDILPTKNPTTLFSSNFSASPLVSHSVPLFLSLRTYGKSNLRMLKAFSRTSSPLTVISVVCVYVLCTCILHLFSLPHIHTYIRVPRVLGRRTPNLVETTYETVTRGRCGTRE